MALFNKPDQQTDIKTNATIISSGTKIKGTIKSDCTLQIDGSHEGIIHANGTVNVGRSGKIDGEVSAKKLTITGFFQGTADCEHVEIRAGGTLRGKVISNNLTIDQNCSFEGESIKKQQAANIKSVGQPKQAVTMSAAKKGA